MRKPAPLLIFDCNPVQDNAPRIGSSVGRSAGSPDVDRETGLGLAAESHAEYGCSGKRGAWRGIRD
jgi:hypothetical protein